MKIQEAVKPCDGYEHPSAEKTSIWRWSCRLAIGPPQWMGMDAYECPECDGEGEIAVPDNEVETDDGFVCTFPDVWCTSCGQHIWHDDGPDCCVEFVSHHGKRKVEGLECFQVKDDRTA